jgi:catechol 2,3-dioxygenase-like lactoylglutathione lyase family enzyme
LHNVRHGIQLGRDFGIGEPIVDGVDGDMSRRDFGHGTFVLFNPAEIIDLAHVAFRVSEEQFDTIVGRLHNLGVSVGNRHDDTRNGQTDDLELDGAGRVYFVDEDGHLFAITC